MFGLENNQDWGFVCASHRRSVHGYRQSQDWPAEENRHQLRLKHFRLHFCCCCVYKCQETSVSDAGQALYNEGPEKHEPESC